ncbi:MAG: glycosyltransferase family 2 protein, partial [Candidatus Shapirobacteria bacterium]|nr:glycosyltransferase family 2 protein [Candidatus Shapirobacteria bacterium]
MKNKLDLSVVILNFNSRDYLQKCLSSIYRSKLNNFNIEVIIVDNNSTDNSTQLAQNLTNNDQKIFTKYLFLKENKGFAHGNNQGIKKINPSSRYVLFLNPDTIVDPSTLKNMIEFFDQDKQVDAATCYINLAITNKMQPECHRGFPTPWRSFCYFIGLTKLFPKSRFFNGYFLGNLNKDTIHQIEACVGAFLMVKKKVGEKINWWSEDYFFYGEDLDFCYQLKENNFKLFFNPNCKITHFQGVSSGIINKSKHLSKASRETKMKVAQASTQAMRIFYKKYLLQKYPKLVQKIVLSGIKLLEIKRVF